MSAPPSEPPSGSSTPNARFTSQAETAEDVLKSQTVGLVNLSDFRKRRAEALELKDRERQSAQNSGASTPQSNASGSVFKKRKKVVKGKLSFGVDDDEDTNDSETSALAPKAAQKRQSTPKVGGDDSKGGNGTQHGNDSDARPAVLKKKLGPNALLANAPRAMTKSALLKDVETREQLRKEFIQIRERVKATEIALPFVFYDGTNIPGGRCKIKKGEQIWLFLDRARKVGAEHGAGSGDRGRREWARVGVDDLMLVRGEIILPHHYEFYYFLINKTLDFNGQRILPYSSEPTAATPAFTGTDEDVDLATYDPMARHKKEQSTATSVDDELEGADEDPTITKVVDRRWYERNKHIFPASIWEEYDPGKDYSKGARKDAQGNTFFFS